MKFIRILLGLLLFIFAVRHSFSQDEKIRTEWLFIYYMPYDNDLSQYGEQIIQMIGDNITSDNVTVTVQADFSDNNGMKRYIISRNQTVITAIENEYSASIQTYREYLEWVKERIDYEKLAVIFLDHGGKLDEICLDEQPVHQFLLIDEISQLFNTVFGKNAIDLLFLQVCTKGVLEALYELKDAAKYTLCSQIPLGAPNDYYHGLFTAFSTQTVTSGREVAELIINHEADYMYNSYTLVDNAGLDMLFPLFSELISQLQAVNTGSLAVPVNMSYDDERYWDIISCLENLPEVENRTKLIEYIRNKLIIVHRISPIRYGMMRRYSGLSISGVMEDKYNKLALYRLLKPVRELFMEKK